MTSDKLSKEFHARMATVSAPNSNLCLMLQLGFIRMRLAHCVWPSPQEWYRRFVNIHAVFWLYFIMNANLPRKAASRLDVGWCVVLCTLIVRHLDKIPVWISEVYRGTWTHCSSSMNRIFQDFNIVSAQVIKNLHDRVGSNSFPCSCKFNFLYPK